jgi:hypothetical protein
MWTFAWGVKGSDTFYVDLARRNSRVDHGAMKTRVQLVFSVSVLRFRRAMQSNLFVKRERQP